jgi:glycerol kinase
LLLPEIKGSSEVYGEATTALCGIPIAGNAGDQQAALFGHMCNQPGMVKNTYGTGCFMLMNTGPQPIVSKNKLVTTVSWRINQKTEYSLEGSVFCAGAVVEWLRDGLGIIRSSDDVERLAATVEDNGGVYFVPAFAGLGAPYWDPYAQGRIVGLTRATKAGHIARAALESIAYQVTDILAAMESDSDAKLSELRVDGGACKNRLLMQFQADILGVPVVSPKNSETTAMGAAYLAGLGVGYFKSTGEISAQRMVGEVFTPRMSQDQRDSLRSGWTKVLSGARSDVHASLP